MRKSIGTPPSPPFDPTMTWTFLSVPEILVRIIRTLGIFLLVGSVGKSSDFYSDVYPILKANCIACHNSQKSDGGLNLESFEAMQKGGDSGAVFVAKSVADSRLVRRIKGEEELMPPSGNNVGARQLNESEITSIQKWIEDGAIAGTKMANSIKEWKPLPDSINPIYAIDSSFLGQTTVIGRGNQAIIHEWAALGGEERYALTDSAVTEQFNKPATHLDIVQSVAASRDGNRVATGGFRDVKIWKRVSGESNNVLARKLRASTCLSVSRDGSKIARTTDAPSIEVFDTATAQLLVRWDSLHPISAISWDLAGQNLWACTDPGNIYLLNMTNNERPSTRNLSDEKGVPIGLKIHSICQLNSQTIVAINSESNLLAWKTALVDGAPQFMEPIQNVTAFKKVKASVRLTDSLFAISPAEQNSLLIVNANDWSIIRTIESRPQIQLFSHSDGVRLIGIDDFGKTTCWNSSDGKLLWENIASRQTRVEKTQAEIVVARQKAKVDRSTNAIPEWEKNKAAEEANLAKVTKSRDDAAEAVNKKKAELVDVKNQLMASEATVEAASKALEEAKAKLETAQKEMASKREQVAAVEKAQAELEQKLTAWNSTVQSATEAIAKVVKSFADFQVRLTQLKDELTALEQKKSEVDAAPTTTKAIAASLTPNTRRLVTLMDSGELRTICTENGESERSLTNGIVADSQLVTDSFGRLFQVDGEGRSRCWELGTRWELERSIGNAEDSPFSDRITALSFSEDGSLLVVGSGPPSRFGELKLISVADGTVVKDWGQIHSDSILCVRISPDGSTVASSGADKLVKLHDLKGDASTRTLEGHTHHVLGIAWHDDGFLLASSSADNTIKVWDVESGQATRTIGGFGKEVTALAFVGRTNQLASASTDHQVRLHDVTNGSQIRAFSGANDAIYSLAVVSAAQVDNSSFLISGGQQGVLWMWKISDGASIKQVP
jgi:WD40 repeat protein